MHAPEGPLRGCCCWAGQAVAFPALPSAAFPVPPPAAFQHPPADCQLQLLLSSPARQQAYMEHSV